MNQETKQHSTWDLVLANLPAHIASKIVRNEPMRRHTTLRIGGPAELYFRATNREDLAALAVAAQSVQLEFIVIGDGSNICVHDSGVRGLVVQNACSTVRVGSTTDTDSGHNFMRLFLRTMQAGLSGLEWAVGIPGTIGGALVSNAGAYGGNICDIVESIDVVEQGVRKTVGKEWMEFSYRDSRLRRDETRPAVLLGAELRFETADKRDIRKKAASIQIQRIMKQPWEPSAGSFFKNVHDRNLAEVIPGLPQLMRERGVVTSAFLIDQCGLKGFAIGDAAISARHANFVVNRGAATAEQVRRLAQTVRSKVLDRFGIELEEEVLYIGGWSQAPSLSPAAASRVKS